MDSVLSYHDCSVLDILLEPNTNSVLSPTSLSETACKEKVDHFVGIAEIEQNTIQLIEAAARNTKEYKHCFEKALTGLNQLIQEFPEYASAYNNRAQLFREMMMVYGETEVDGICITQLIEQDLRKAINLAKSITNPTITTYNKKVLAQAYSQLGAMNLVLRNQPCISDNSLWELEKEASENLYLGGLYGNKLAKAASIPINPYAKLCGSMMNEVLKFERSCTFHNS